MAENCEAWWWARQGLNLRPLRCEHNGYGHYRRKTANRRNLISGTSAAQTGNRGEFHRAFTAAVS